MNVGTRKSRRALNRRLKFHLMLVGALSSLAIGCTATISYFSDTAEAEVTVTAGTINLGIGQAEQKDFSMDLGSGWVQGMSVSKEVAIHNTGTIPLKYTMSTNWQEYFGYKIKIKILSGDELLVDSDFNSAYINQRYLESNTSETLTFIVTWDDSNGLDPHYSDIILLNIFSFTASNIN